MSVVSPTLCFYVKKSFTSSENVHPHPFCWDERLNVPEVCRSRSGNLTWFCNIGYILFHFCFLLVQMSRLSSRGELTQEMMTYLLLLLISAENAAMSQMCNVMMRDQVPQFVQRIFGLMEKFDGDLKFLDQEDKQLTHDEATSEVRVENGATQDTTTMEIKMKQRITLIPKSCDAFFFILFWAAKIAVVVAWFHNILLPESPEFTSSVILPLLSGAGSPVNAKDMINNMMLKWIVILTSASSYAYYWILISSNMYLWIFTGFSFVFSGIVSLREIKSRINIKVRDKKAISRVQIRKLLSMYRDLEILRKSFHFIYCTLFYPLIKVIAMLVVTFGIYGGMKMEGLIRVFMVNAGAVGGAVLFVMVATLAEFHTQSTEIFRLMKSSEFQKNLTAYEKCIMRSLSLIQVKMGSSYVVDKGCVVTIFWIMINNTINFLLWMR